MTHPRLAMLGAMLVATVSCSRGSEPTDRDDTPQASVSKSSSIQVTRLRWDATPRPVSNLRFDPRLEWQLASKERGQRQTAYQVLVATDQSKVEAGKADVWDSGKVVSAGSINVLYAGRDLLARERGFWTVRVWDEHDRPSAFAPAATWEVSPWEEEVEAEWIGRAKRPGESEQDIERSVVYLRQTFTAPAGFKEARLYASAFGLYEMSINGRRVGDDVLSPGYTDYPKRVLHQPRDVTSFLRPGDNVIGGILAGGWCTARLAGASPICGSNPPRLWVALEVTGPDGSRQTLESDEEWKYATGPLLTAQLFQGESYDARREMPGWDAPGFAASGWRAAVQYDGDTEHDVRPDPGVPMRVSEDIAPTSVSEPSPGSYVFDLGRSIVGWARLSVETASGSELTLRYAQGLRPDGNLALEPAAKQVTDRYVARGSGLEAWEPRFSLREFRYVELKGLAARPAVSVLTGRVVHSEMSQTGSLETSSAPVNQLFGSIMNAQRSAFLSVPSFGGGRSQRLGSLFEAQVVAQTACLNRDVQRFYRKWIDDIRDAQLPSAAYSELAPAASARAGSASAGVAGVLVPYALHRCYADRTSLDMHITSMGRFLSFVRDSNPDLIWRRELGADSGDPGESGAKTDAALLATAELAHAAGALAEMMRGGGPALAADAGPFQKLAEETRAAFSREFVLADGRLKSDTQSAYAVAIARGVLVGPARDLAGQHLAAALERAGGKPTTGVLGSALLLPALSLVGRDELAYGLLFGFAESGTASPALGEWMYDAIAGLALDPAAPAGRHVLVRPRPGGGLTSAKASYASLYGPIETEWALEAKAFRMKLRLPVGSSATVTLPFAGMLSEGGVPVAKAKGVKVVSADGKANVVDVESGSYELVVERP